MKLFSRRDEKREPCRSDPALRIGAVLALIGSVILLVPGTGGAAEPSASDPRATFVPGNATTCSQIGFGSDIQLGSGSDSSASDANVTGTVKTNAGSVNPGEGQELDVAITAAGVTAGVVIDAVVVKGGPAYNKYTNSAVLPPTLPPDQHYISPFNPGGNIPGISHWFVCYRVSAPPVGSLSVTKAVAAPGGTPVTPLPTSYTAVVNCNDGVHTNITVTFGAGGGAGTPASITGIALGTVCTVVEQNTASFPAGTVVSYNPAGANTTGVTIGAEVGVTVTITNDFTRVAVLADVVVTPVVVTPAFTG